MEKEFVPYELAVKLKELGFDEDCLAFYDGTKAFTYSPNNIKIYAVKILAPLWQQAFDWFSEKHKINNFVTRCPRGIWSFEIFRDVYSDCWEIYFNTKEEARQACLEKLIELCKKNQ